MQAGGVAFSIFGLAWGGPCAFLAADRQRMRQPLASFLLWKYSVSMTESNPVTLRIKREPALDLFERKGLRTREKQALAVGTSMATMSRVLAGSQAPNAGVIAGLARLFPRRWRSLLEVVDDVDKAAA